MTTVKWSKFLGTDYITGLKLTWAGDKALTIGTGAAYLPAANPILVSTAITLTGMTLANSTEYHVYLYDIGGTPAAHVVTTAPAAPYFGTARTETGDASKRYLGSFFTDATGDIRYFTHNPQTNQIKYARDALNFPPYLVANALTAASATSVSCSGIIPATATNAYMRIRSDADQFLHIGDSALSTSAFHIVLPPIHDDSQIVYADIPVTSQAFYYLFGAAVGIGMFYGAVVGYTFER